LKRAPRVPEGSHIDDYAVEDHADHALGAFKMQREAIDWAKSKGHAPLVARVPRGQLAAKFGEIISQNSFSITASQKAAFERCDLWSARGSLIPQSASVA
jgi:hypothetical protein